MEKLTAKWLFEETKKLLAEKNPDSNKLKWMKFSDIDTESMEETQLLVDIINCREQVFRNEIERLKTENKRFKQEQKLITRDLRFAEPKR